jgi:hypothetical protein
LNVQCFGGTLEHTTSARCRNPEAVEHLINNICENVKTDVEN